MSGQPSVYSTFEAAARDALAFLQARIGFDLWMITRASGDDQIVLASRDRAFGITPGLVVPWAGSLCVRMAAGAGPRIAPRLEDVPAYCQAPNARLARIGAYIGIPLPRRDGTLFGTLCAFHPDDQPAHIQAELPLLELLARQLCTILDAELREAELVRRVERAEALACTDDLTGLFNRRGWDGLLAAEEERCKRYGHAACVLVIDLDELKQTNDELGHAAGDRLLQATGEALRRAVRSQDVVARVGGDEFAVLGVECDGAGATRLQGRVRRALAAAQIEASIGLAQRDPGSGLGAAVREADSAMYQAKRARCSASPEAR